MFGVLLAEVYGEVFEIGQSHRAMQGFGWMSETGMVVEPDFRQLEEMGLNNPVTEEDWCRALDLFDPPFAGPTLVNRKQLITEMCDYGVPFADIADYMVRCEWGDEVLV